MPEPKPPPRRRIAPIPIQPAVEPEPGLVSNGAELCQHMPDVSLPPMPGRRMVVDLLACNTVNYKKVLKNHMRSHSAGTATQQQGSSLPPSPQAAQQAHGKNADLIKRIQEKYVVHMDDTNSASQSGQGASGSDGAESSGSESTSSEDSKADVVSSGKPGDPQVREQGWPACSS
ncbi:hypothetical protein HaLaN_19068 [Haematococcus lacustris]|uniref:Uncharacterized protein n=1 Tax=Haematococcus lacustris TaxID=44745 RepID=A0A699ZKZ0_HAELA|nr:hypothetical protein HaLaN_19068 [Haematococcus lacustris]